MKRYKRLQTQKCRKPLQIKGFLQTLQHDKSHCKTILESKRKICYTIQRLSIFTIYSRPETPGRISENEVCTMLELLAPAGSMEALRAAVQNGADAVYLGCGPFNARQNARNFTKETLPKFLLKF